MVLRRQLPSHKVVLRRHAEGIGHPIEEGEHGRDVDSLGNLVFVPAGIAQLLHVLMRRTRGILCYQLHVVEKCALGRRQSGFLKFAFENRRYALIGSSLSPQEVSVAVESIGAPVQVRDVAGNHLFMSPREMPFREVNRIRELHDLPQKVRSRAEALDDAWHLLPSRSLAPEVVGSRRFAGRLVIFGDADLGWG
jgi:hypothetical protein